MTRTYAILASLAGLLAISGFSFAQTGYGTSSISLNATSASVAQAGAVSVAYTVNLASGSTWGTTLIVQNQAELSQSGISVSISNPNGDPPYSGTATITTSQSTPAGAYSVTFAATGDDPSTAPADFLLTVSSAATTAPASIGPNTTVQSTSIPYSSTAPATTINQPAAGGQGSAPAYVSIIAVIVLFAVIALAFKFA